MLNTSRESFITYQHSNAPSKSLRILREFWKSNENHPKILVFLLNQTKENNKMHNYNLLLDRMNEIENLTTLRR